MTVTDTGLAGLHALPDVHIPLTLTVLDPISHGAGTSGNTQLLRTQDVLQPDGRRVAVPYVSGNSLRHTLRSALAWHLARVLDVAEQSLPKTVVDLLWSGGALSETGSQVDLALARRVSSDLPALSLMGYSARSDITAGTLWVDNVHVVCAENAFRLPGHLAGHPHAVLPGGAMRGEAFGTRHDVRGSAVDRYIELLGGDLVAPPTTQMIYDLQVIKPGAVLWGGLTLSCPTPGHVAALAVAVDEAMPVVSGRRVLALGGKRSTGYGTCAVEADFAGVDIASLREAYEAHLRGRRDAILALLSEVVG
ncbi:hypothetical protein ACQEUU_37705 [Nonomuraea sp. CA-218870]|uniref:hypothetical protein n=1 Tax=Nonomuraea sp. CA-218870 TaxID=3239998 RepID=UPI003D94C9B1